MILKALNDIMEFDHVIEVTESREIIERGDVYAPSLNDGLLDDDTWSLMNGYSSQYGYSGPIMHSSEFIGGRMERDIRDTPGLYVSLVDYLSDGESEGWAVAFREIGS